MTTTGMNRFDAYGPPGRGGVDTVRAAADKVAAPARAIEEIKSLIATDLPEGHPWAACVNRADLRDILERHGL